MTWVYPVRPLGVPVYCCTCSRKAALGWKSLIAHFQYFVLKPPLSTMDGVPRSLGQFGRAHIDFRGFAMDGEFLLDLQSTGWRWSERRGRFGGFF